MDHKPLLSFFEPESKRRKGLFRYDRRLNDNGEVKDIILDVWQSSGTIPIKDRIAKTRVAITEWNKTQHRNSRRLIEEKKTELEAALCSPVNNTTLIQDITSQLNNAYLAEEAYWKQRSRLLWLKLGDRNTGFFHATTKGRKRANSFSVLEDAEGTACYKEEEISKIIVKYFKEMFTSMGASSNKAETVRRALQPMVLEEENNSLIALPTAQEIRDALFSIHADKAPGPDGFSAAFYQTHWQDIGPDIVAEVQSFYAQDRLLGKINDTHIRLIPKIKSPQRVADHSPIALCNVYYKIYSKILTRRLQPILSSIISENQSAFVPDRAISDNVLITHEVLHYLKTTKAEKRCSMAVKTDMSKHMIDLNGTSSLLCCNSSNFILAGWK